MHIKESGAIRRRPGRSLGQTVAAGPITPVVAMGIGRFAYAPILPVPSSLLMPAVGFVGTINARRGKECVNDTEN